MISAGPVTPAKAGVQARRRDDTARLDSRIRGNDGESTVHCFPTRNIRIDADDSGLCVLRFDNQSGKDDRDEVAA